MTEYSASLDRLSKFITTAVTLILLSSLFLIDHLNDEDPRKEYSFIMAFMLFMNLLPFFTFFYQPRSYVADDVALMVKRRAGNFRIPVETITAVYTVSRKEMSIPLRVFGNGGMFGYTGYYRNSRFGSMRWFATRRNNYIIIETRDDKKFVITPDDPEELSNDLNKRLLKVS